MTFMSDPYYYRNEYGRSRLEKKDLPASPVDLFEQWLTQAFEEDLPEPTAMTLATAAKSGKVSSRIILLKGYDTGGFQFYTNYHSKKGKDLSENPYAAMSFFWPELERQVRIEGRVEKIPPRDSDLYHSARPRNNQLGAWASEQSKPIANRETLQSQFDAVSKAYEKQNVIPRPPNWGGYKLIPSGIEFWQGRENRLHDRFYYEREQTGRWSIQRLSP